MTSPDQPLGYWAPPPPGTPSTEPPLAAEPLALRFDPVRGWRQADRPRRMFILAFPVLIAGWLIPNYIPNSLWAVTPVLLLAPGIHFSVARWLRPYPPEGVSGSRKVRHALAAFGASVAFGLLLSGRVQNDEIVNAVPVAVLFLVGIPALLAGVITAVWGVIECAVRASQRSARRL